MSNKQPKRPTPAKGQQVRLVPVPDSFDILTDKEMARIEKDRKELRHARAKLHELSKRSKAVGAVAKERRPEAIESQDLQYLLSLQDPFEHRNVPIPSMLQGNLAAEIPIPGKTTFSTFDTFTMEVISSGVNAGKGFLVAPCHYAACYAATGNDSHGALINTMDTGPSIWQHQYMAGGVAQNFPLTNQSTLVYDTTAGGRTQNQFVVQQYAPSRDASVVIDRFDTCRMVSGGVRLGNIGEVLGQKGKMAVAWLPPGVVPSNVNTATSGDIMVGSTMVLTYDFVAGLPGAQIYSAMDSVTATLLPADPAAFEYSPTKYLPKYYKYSPSGRGVGTYYCPPCIGYPQQFKSAMDVAMLGTGGNSGNVAFSVAAPADTRLNQWAVADMMAPMTGLGSIVVAFEACDTAGSFNVEIVANYEGVSETRNLAFGSVGVAGHHATPHESAYRAVALAANLPRSHKTGSGIYSKIRPFLKKALQVGKGLLSNIGGPANAARWVSSELGIELPEAFGSIIEAGAALAAF